MQVKIGVRFHHAEITHFQIVCKRQVDYMWRNLLLIKVRVLNRIFTKNCVTGTEILLVSFVMYFFFFAYHPWIAASEDRSLAQPQEHQHPCPILLEIRQSSPLLCKNHKNPEVDKKIQTCDTLLHDDDHDELFLWYGWLTKGFYPYFQPGPLSEILTIANIRHVASRIEPVQNLGSDFVVWSCAVVITTTPQRPRALYFPCTDAQNS